VLRHRRGLIFCLLFVSIHPHIGEELTSTTLFQIGCTMNRMA
jgi:hypothetical protein